MKTVTQRDEVRTYVLVERHSQRQAAQHFEVSRNTIAKLLAEDPSPVERRYQRQVPRPTPVADQVVPHIEQWLQENAWLDRWHPKQRWTAHRMWSELKTMNLEVAESTVRQLVRERRPATTPAFIPLDFAPGERAEFDFGEASIVLAGQTRTIPFLAGRLRFSGAMFAMAFPTQRQDAFLYGQQQAFAFWGGVPRIIVYDNLKPAVLKMLHGHARQEQAAFTHFHSVYRFEPLFANPRSGWEKGSVENLVGYTRRNFFVPIPEVSGWPELEQHLRRCAQRDQQRVMSGRTDTIAARLAHEQQWLGPLPAVAPEVGIRRDVVVRSTARVHFETNQYSVPNQYAYQRVVLQAAPFQVRLFANGQLIAEHPRSYDKYQISEDWRHYVSALLEKPFAVPFASALRHGGLPAEWEAWRQSLVARRPDGNREFARMLELAASTSLEAVAAAMALMDPHSDWDADTLRHIVDWATTSAPALPELAGYPELAAPDIHQYDRLLEVQA